MLTTLAISDFVLIDRLHLQLSSGLTALTGETGAGKSILLDALSMALGERAQARYVRAGATQATITAEFSLDENHAVHQILQEHGIVLDDCVIIKRILGDDGKSRALINDQPVSVNLLRQVGELLVDIHGQFDRLLDSASHRDFLDEFAGCAKLKSTVKEAYLKWRKAKELYEQAQEKSNRASQDAEYLAHCVDELVTFGPEEGEEQSLIEERNRHVNHAQISQSLHETLQILLDEDGAETLLGRANRCFSASVAMGGEAFEQAMMSLERAVSELQEAISQLESLESSLELDPATLDRVEERLSQMRALCRKHNCTSDELATKFDQLQAELLLINDSGDILEQLRRDSERTRDEFILCAKDLSQLRQSFASKLDAAVKGELPPLKMEKAGFKTLVTELWEPNWSEHGINQVSFEVSTNPGQPFGKLSAIASGGERARFMLALKVILANGGGLPTMVFDEVDSGVGGAVAYAVGQRLAALGKSVQVLVVTHSPQVAAVANQQLQVAKQSLDSQTLTSLTLLDNEQRREEIARMLSGAKITNEARAAADQLLYKEAV